MGPANNCMQHLHVAPACCTGSGSKNRTVMETQVAKFPSTQADCSECSQPENALGTEEQMFLDDNTEQLDTTNELVASELMMMDKPLHLREKGNQYYSAGDYASAIEYWLASVKQSLKQSVRTPSKALYDNLIHCRLNLAMGYLKQNDWVNACNQAKFVLDQRPQNMKALYRYAQALEKMEDWPECRKTLRTMLKAVRDDHTVKSRPGQSDEIEGPGSKETDEEEDDRDQSIDLCGLTKESVEAFVQLTERRIHDAEVAYKKKQKRLYKGIGASLGDCGISTDRVCEKSSTVRAVDEISGAHHQMGKDADLAKDLIGFDLSSVVRWQHQNPPSVDEASERIVINEDVRNTQQKVCGVVPIIQHDPSVEQQDDVDDRNGPVWTKNYNVESLKADKRPLIMSLPLTFCWFVQLVMQSQKLLRDDDISTSLTAEPNPPPQNLAYSLDDVATAIGRVRRRLLCSIIRRRSLTIHVIGARGDTEMESQWTAVLKRLPTLKTLQIIFVGFLDKDDHWSRGLREGVISHPLVKSQGLTGDQKLVCRLYKGMYQLFLQEHPTALSDEDHQYYPDLVMIPEPRLSIYFDSWVPVLSRLLQEHIPTLVTAYSAKDFATHDAANLPPVLHRLAANWAVPLQPNPFAIRVIPEEDCPPMSLWAPPGEQREMFRGVSAKHAVIGCFIGHVNEVERTESFEGWIAQEKLDELRKSLVTICDVEEASLLRVQQEEQKVKDSEMEKKNEEGKDLQA